MAMKVMQDSEVQWLMCISLAVVEGKWPACHPGHFTPRVAPDSC